METLQRLQKWYKSQCDGDWEHTFGVTIETLDNPGWNIKIDLEDTSLENAKVELTNVNGDLDWYFIKASDKKYRASGDPDKLHFLIGYFLNDFLPQFSNDDFHYEILVPMVGGPTEIWTPCKAKLINEETFEIVEIPGPDFRSIITQSLDDITFNESDIEEYGLSCKIGDKIEVHLIETFDGIKVAMK